MDQKKQRPVLWANALITGAIFVLNYFYQADHFNYVLKCVCSIGFALMGVINFFYTRKVDSKNRRFYALLMAALIFAMAGDIVLKVHFIGGAAVFALGHLFFLAAYFCLENENGLDLVVCGAWMVGSCAFMLWFPLFDFGGPLMKTVCVAYALLIAMMLGKAMANWIKKRNTFRTLLLIGSVLFYLSDLMLVLELFAGWGGAAHICMALYYPALCMLAVSMLWRTKDEK